jgi:hypothetical protein
MLNIHSMNSCDASFMVLRPFRKSDRDCLLNTPRRAKRKEKKNESKKQGITLGVSVGPNKKNVRLLSGVGPCRPSSFPASGRRNSLSELHAWTGKQSGTPFGKIHRG